MTLLSRIHFVLMSELYSKCLHVPTGFRRSKFKDGSRRRLLGVIDNLPRSCWWRGVCCDRKGQHTERRKSVQQHHGTHTWAQYVHNIFPSLQNFCNVLILANQKIHEWQLSLISDESSVYSCATRHHGSVNRDAVRAAAAHHCAAGVSLRPQQPTSSWSYDVY